MYSTFQLGKKFIRYWLTADNGKGHGVHSPFVFEFITKVLNDRSAYDCYRSIEPLRRQLLRQSAVVELEDFGAGSRMHPSYKRRVSEIAQSSLKPKKYAQLLYRMARYYRPASVLELGTSLGITTAYLASAGGDTPVTTMEGATAIAAIARNNFDRLGLRNITLREGNFDHTLPRWLQLHPRVDFAYIDGNHRQEPTLRYFNWLLPYVHNDTILVFDDIHWSSEMEAAWATICGHPQVTLTVDLFFIGIVFFRAEQKIKQDFTIRF